MFQIWVHRGDRQQRRRNEEANQHILRFEEQNHDRAECDQRRPPPENQHRALHGVSDAQHAVVQVHAIGMHRRLAFAQPPHNRKTHVEDRQEQHEHRQQNRHEHRQVDAGVDGRRIETARHDDRRAGDQVAEQHGAGISHEQFRRMPVMQDEADAHADHGDVDQRRHGCVRRRASCDDVRIDGEGDAADRDDARSEAVKTVHEVDRVDGRDDKERGDGHRQARRRGDERAERQRDDLQAAPGHKHGDEQLTGEFEHPVKVPQIVGHAQQADHNGAG